MPVWDLLFVNANIATMCRDQGVYGIVENAALAVTNGEISWIGSEVALPHRNANQVIDTEKQWLTPALIDCHTHLIFGGDRALEFERRLNGVSYAQIAQEGGGIRSTVEATRTATKGQLFNSAQIRIQRLMQEGVATIEVKSGYGLDRDTELTMLEVGRELNNKLEADVVTTFLGAHSIPVEYHTKSDEYLHLVINDVLPVVHDHDLADAIDAYCEHVAFSAEQVRKLFEAATNLDLPVKLHADQLSQCDGAELAASFNALSADHLEYTNTSGVEALAESGTIAVLLPGPFLVLNEKQLPPIDALRDYDVPIAIATDCNPGSSPLCSLRMAMNLACNMFQLTPEECLAGVTRNAAIALGLANDRGTLELGKRADIALWNILHPRELTYWAGVNQLAQLYIKGHLI
ncbi:MAG: imidazolonepropionase [Gammaproteobacteria bacterium]|nr:imidazolonepropionase [Gammaproteobacteria bacterium]